MEDTKQPSDKQQLGRSIDDPSWSRSADFTTSEHAFQPTDDVIACDNGLGQGVGQGVQPLISSLGAGGHASIEAIPTAVTVGQGTQAPLNVARGGLYLNFTTPTVHRPQPLNTFEGNKAPDYSTATLWGPSQRQRDMSWEANPSGPRIAAKHGMPGEPVSASNLSFNTAQCPGPATKLNHGTTFMSLDDAKQKAINSMRASSVASQPSSQKQPPKAPAAMRASYSNDQCHEHVTGQQPVQKSGSSPAITLDALIRSESVAAEDQHLSTGPGVKPRIKFTQKLSELCQSRGFNPLIRIVPLLGGMFEGKVELGCNKMTTWERYTSGDEAREVAARMGYDWMLSHPDFRGTNGDVPTTESRAPVVKVEQRAESVKPTSAKFAKRNICFAPARRAPLVKPHARPALSMPTQGASSTVFTLPGNVTTSEARQRVGVIAGTTGGSIVVNLPGDATAEVAAIYAAALAGSTGGSINDQSSRQDLRRRSDGRYHPDFYRREGSRPRETFRRRQPSRSRSPRPDRGYTRDRGYGRDDNMAAGWMERVVEEEMNPGAMVVEAVID